MPPLRSLLSLSLSFSLTITFPASLSLYLSVTTPFFRRNVCVLTKCVTDWVADQFPCTQIGRVCFNLLQTFVSFSILFQLFHCTTFSLLAVSNFVWLWGMIFPGVHGWENVSKLHPRSHCRTKSNQRWMKLRTTVQISSAMQKKPPLKREDSFLKRFSTRQIPEAQVGSLHSVNLSVNLFLIFFMLMYLVCYWHKYSSSSNWWK